MNSLNRTEILDASVEFIPREFATPLVLSTGAITHITEARVSVRVRVGNRETVGRGSIYLSDLWAWPDPALSHDERDHWMRGFCQDFAEHLPDYCGGESAHPLELGMRLHGNACRDNHPPRLARALCASPFDAAIHDAAGIALQQSAFAFYEELWECPSVDGLFKSGSACQSIRAILKKPCHSLPAWWIIGKNDSLEEDVLPAIRKGGYACFKLKLMGKDVNEDVRRTVEVYQALKRIGVPSPRLSVDTNEANPGSNSVLEYLERLKLLDENAYSALEYFEQPTSRDILAHPQDWHSVSRLKPVLLDEGLDQLAILPEAVRQGWSGLALKTCKGHSFALVAAAWAREHGLLLTLQDLTNPGYSLIHAALFAAHIPMLNGVELNSPQFTPAANAEWLPRLSGLFEPRKGVHMLPEKVPYGLGSCL